MAKQRESTNKCWKSLGSQSPSNELYFHFHAVTASSSSKQSPGLRVAMASTEPTISPPPLTLRTLPSSKLRLKSLLCLFYLAWLCPTFSSSIRSGCESWLSPASWQLTSDSSELLTLSLGSKCRPLARVTCPDILRHQFELAPLLEFLRTFWFPKFHFDFVFCLRTVWRSLSKTRRVHSFSSLRGSLGAFLQRVRP